MFLLLPKEFPHWDDKVVCSLSSSSGGHDIQSGLPARVEDKVQVEPGLNMGPLPCGVLVDEHQRENT